MPCFPGVSHTLMQPCLFNLLPSETAPQSVFVFWKAGVFKEIYFCQLRQTHKYFTEMSFRFGLSNSHHRNGFVRVFV